MYGSTTVSETFKKKNKRQVLQTPIIEFFREKFRRLNYHTFGDGTTEYVFIILSGYSSLILEMSKVPIPDPVPPPKECVS